MPGFKPTAIALDFFLIARGLPPRSRRLDLSFLSYTGIALRSVVDLAVFVVGNGPHTGFADFTQGSHANIYRTDLHIGTLIHHSFGSANKYVQPF